MSSPKSFAATLLLFCLLCLLCRITLAANPLNETVFLVGPLPQPLVYVTGDAPLGSVHGIVDPNNGIQNPFPASTLPVQLTEGGGRKLNARPMSHSSSSDVGSSPRPPSRNNRRTAPVTRSLGGQVCNVTNTILSLKFEDNVVENGYYTIPADPSGAAGVSRLVAAVNSMVEVRSKDGTLIFRDGLRSFFVGATSAAFFRPKVIYDEHEGRFLLVAVQVRLSPQLSRIWVAVSKNEMPDTAGDWYQSSFNSIVPIGGGNTYAYFLGFEVDEEAIYVTSSMAPFTVGNYGSILWFTGKGVNNGGFYSGGAPTFNLVDPFAGGGIVVPITPAQVHGSNGVDGSVGTFLVSVVAYDDGRIDIQIVTISNPLSVTPTYTVQTRSLGIIGSAGPVPKAQQLGSTSTIEAGDYNVLDVVWRNNSMWVVFTIDPKSGVNQGQATAYWARFVTSGENVTLEAQGSLGGEGRATGTHTFFPSVAVNRLGLVAYGYGAASNSTYIGAYASVGISEEVYTVKSGIAPYLRTLGGRNDWGPYSGISVDPVDDSFWFFNSYAEAVGIPLDGDGRWATVWGRLECAPAPSPAPSVSPSKAPTGAPSNAPIRGPTMAPVPTSAPVPVAVPTKKSCGLFGLSLFCPFTFCGLFGRWLGFCRS